MARIALTAGMVIAGSTATQAAAWNASAASNLHAGYDDNVRLSFDTAPSSTYSSMDAVAHLALQDEAWSWNMDPRAVLTRYRNYPALNRTESYLTSSLQRQTEREKSSLLFSWVQDTTLTSELGLTGLAETNKRHQASALTLSNDYQWTERFDTQGTIYVTSNHYMDAHNTGLVNYNYGTGQLDIGYALTPRSQLSLEASIGKLQVPGQSQYGKINQSMMLSYSVSFAERWNGKVSIGPSQVHSDFSKESGTVYDVSIGRKSETSTLQLKLTRDITPTGEGVLTRRQQISLNFTQALTERLSAGMSASLITNTSLLLANNSNFYGVHYNDINANLSWHWTPTWTVSASAGHTEQRLENATRTATRNYLSLNLGWSGLTHTLH